MSRVRLAPRFENFPPYTPIEPFEVLSARLGLPPEKIVKVDANENPYGPAPDVKEALAGMRWANIYPDPESRALRAALSAFTGVAEENLLPGSGADELIDLILRLLLEPGDVVLNFPPTFGMYPFDTLLNAGQVIDIPRLPDFSLDLPAIRRAVAEHKPKAMFLTTPNNPDGNFPPAAVIDELLDLPLMVVIDEAYIEFTQNSGRLGETLSRIRDVAKRENLIVLRTFSKWAGLAGLRVGYGAFPTWLMPALWAAKQPYNINVAASEAALASLRQLDYLAANVDRLKSERERLFGLLQSIPYLEPYPSQANFILCNVKGMPALEVKNRLAARGILVRYYNTPYLRDMIRISIGKPQESDTVVAALRQLGEAN